eukprot:84394_1
MTTSTTEHAEKNKKKTRIDPRSTIMIGEGCWLIISKSKKSKSEISCNFRMKALDNTISKIQQISGMKPNKTGKYRLNITQGLAFYKSQYNDNAFKKLFNDKFTYDYVYKFNERKNEKQKQTIISNKTVIEEFCDNVQNALKQRFLTTISAQPSPCQHPSDNRNIVSNAQIAPFNNQNNNNCQSIENSSNTYGKHSNNKTSTMSINKKLNTIGKYADFKREEYTKSIKSYTNTMSISSASLQSSSNGSSDLPIMDTIMDTR